MLVASLPPPLPLSSLQNATVRQWAEMGDAARSSAGRVSGFRSFVSLRAISFAPNGISNVILTSTLAPACYRLAVAIVATAEYYVREFEISRDDR